MSRRKHGWVGLALALSCAAAGARAQDFDRDGLLDAGDNCPTVANAGQEDRGGLASYQPNGSGDLCECGDVNGDGAAHLNDATLIRRQFAGLGPGLARPELCNVAGAPDPSDTDTDGRRDDCNLVDLVVLRRAFLGLAPGRGTACGNLAPADQVAPTVELIAPARVTAAQPFAVRALARDDVGVGRVVLLVDGIAAREVAGSELALDVTAPGLPGAALALRAEAFDAAGNRGEAAASVVVDGTPDVTPPTVSLLAPPTAAPGSAVALAATAADDRGVALVRFLRGGELIATDASAPYAAALAIEPGAEPDTLVALAAEAVDAEGNTGRADRSLRVVAAADDAAPTNVIVTAPPRALAGQTVSASATAQDDVGLLAIEFFVDGALAGSDAQPPYEASFAIPAGTAPGTSLRWSARAVDFSSNAATSPEVQTVVAAPGRALVVGEVYDDTRSQPLAGARVQVEGFALETTTDARGRFALDLAEGPARLRVAREGWSEAQRRIGVPETGVISPLDCRLTPRAAAARVGPASGSTISSADGRVSIALPAGALAGETDLRVTPLSEQGLPAPLPVGWSPIAAAELAPTDLALALDGLVTFTGVELPNAAIAARFDAQTGVWRRVALSADGIALAAGGAVALALPDTEPAPALPALGEALADAAPGAIPADATAEILPSPRVLFLSPDARSDVSVALDASSALPSGTSLAVRFAESYDRTDDSRLVGDAMVQDVLLYRRAAGMRAAFPATPSELFDASLLREGVIDLAAVVSDLATRAQVDPAGGVVTTPDGVAVEIPPGALAAPAPVALARMTALDPALAADARLRFAGGVALDLAGLLPAAPVVLRVATTTPPGPGESVLVVRRVRVRDATRFEWVGIAEADGANLVLRPGALGLPLPGADAGGEYLFVALSTPLAYVAGVVTPPVGIALASALAQTPSLPFVSLADAADPRYALAVTLGDSSVTGTDQTNGATATAAIAPTVAGAILAQDLALATTRPAVASVTPADLARQVDVDAAVSVAFTRPIDARSLTTDTFRLLEGAAPVAGALFVAADGLSATFRPAAPLRGLAPYTIAVGPQVFDVFGNALLGNQLDGSFLSAFETFDTAPPPRPAAGLITLSIPRDGETELRGSVGAAAQGTLVFAFNATTGLQTAAVAEADGSFFALLPAAPGDDVVLALQSLAGEITVLDPIPFTDADGSAVVGARGGAFESPAGVRLSALPRALARTDLVRLVDLSSPELPADVPAGLTLLRGFRLEVPPALVQIVSELEIAELSGRIVGAQSFATPLRVQATRVTSPGTTTTTRFEFRAQATDTSGTERAVSAQATGSATPCSGVSDVAGDDVAPRLRLRAPACLGPSQSFDLAAEAIQPRFDLSAPAPPGDAPGTQYLLLRRVAAGSQVVYALEETATVQTVLGAPRVISDSRTPFGLRASGDYLIARADAPLAFVEGVASGDPALLATNRSTLGAATSGPNGAFLLPVPAGLSFALRTLSPADGGERASAGLAAVAAGQTLAAGFVGPAAPSALTVEITPPSGATLAANASLGFRFSEPLDPATVVATSLFVQDDEGRVVEGTRVLSAGDTVAAFQPRRPWRAGESYTFRVTRGLLARSGARLVADATGSFSAFSPALLATIPGEDVRDAAVRGPVAYVLDGNRLRALDLTAPASPVEGAPLALSPTPNRVGLAADGASLLVTSGTITDPGTLSAFALASPLAPVLSASARLSTPAGAPPAPEASALAGSPGPLTALAGAVVVSNRGVGLQRVDLAGLLAGTLSAPPPAFETAANLADAASDGSRVASIGPAGLQLHDPATLALVGSAPVDGTAQNVDLATVGARTLALVAAGLPGGVQVFDVTSPATPTRVAKVLTGCAAQRVAADAPFERAWIACAGTRILPLDLATVDGLEPIDRDADGRDDRLGGAISVPVPLQNFTLDAPRNVALVSGGAAGLAVVQLGPAEARIADVIRDPLEADVGDAQSILGDGRAFYGDTEIRASVDARIPPGHPGLRASLSGDAPLAFPDAAREGPLVPGASVLRLRPTALRGSATSTFRLELSEAAALLASFSGRLEPVALDQVQEAHAATDALDLGDASSAPLSVLGRTSSGAFVNLSPLASFEVDPAFGSVAPDGSFQPTGGGTTLVSYAVGDIRGGVAMTSRLPPVPQRLLLEPLGIRLRSAGAAAPLQIRAVLTDGSVREVSAADGVVFASDDVSVATVSPGGVVTAAGAGLTQVEASLGAARGSASVWVDFFVPPDLSGIDLRVEPSTIHTDEGGATVSVQLRGTGSRDGIDVGLELAGVAGALPASAATSSHGMVSVVLDELRAPGAGVLTARVTDPFDGDVFTASAPIVVVERNRDVEPNDSTGSAILATPGAHVLGSVGAADAEDDFRFEPDSPGTLRVRLDPPAGAPIRLVLRDAAGATLAEGVAGPLPLELSADVAAEPAFAIVQPLGGGSAYALRADFEGAQPAIDRIEPASAPPGALVRIEGSGFSRDPELDTVLFERLHADVIEASPTALRVRVPAFATPGPVTVSVGSRTSNAVSFDTGVAGNWWDEAFYQVPEPGDFAIDPDSGATVLRDRILISFRSDVTRANVEAVAASLGATIAALWPPTNEYTLRFAGAGVASLGARVTELAARPDVRYANLVDFPTPDRFPIVARDNFPSHDISTAFPLVSAPRQLAAWSLIRAFEAWELVADSGRFAAPGDFFPVRVAVVDQGLRLTPGNSSQLLGAVTALDRVIYADEIPGDHGTHVAALIGARNIDDPNPRMAGVLGGLLAPDQAPFYRVELYNGSVPTSGSIDQWEVSAALAGCESTGFGSSVVLDCRPELRREMHVANFSFSSKVSVFRLTASRAWYADLIKSRPGTLFVISAGNSSLDANVFVPASVSRVTSVSSRVITVGAVDPDGVASRLPADERWAETYLDEDGDTVGSNFGRAVDLVAPGTGVISVPVAGSGTTGQTFSFFSGTSAAAPLVAGAAALLKALDPEQPIPPDELRRLLLASGTSLAGTATNWQRGSLGSPRRLDIHAAALEVFKRRADREGEQDGTTPFLPGRKRHLWLPDTKRGQMTRLSLPAGFAGAFIVNGTPASRRDVPLGGAEACPRPIGITPSATGDKLYVACEGSAALLVWSANRHTAALHSEVGRHISLPDPVPPHPSIEMALSPAGDLLAVPLAGKRIALVDTRSDRLLPDGTLQLPPSAIGQVRAVAFGTPEATVGPLGGPQLTSRLYALSAEPRAGNLVLLGTLFGAPQSTNGFRQWSFTGATPKLLSFPDTDEPRGLVVQAGSTGADDLIYVYYSGPRTKDLASIHDPVTLALVDPDGPGPLIGKIPFTIPGRVQERAPFFQAGDFVTTRADDAVLRTGTSIPRGFVIHPWYGNALMLFQGTANIGVLEQVNTPDSRPIFAQLDRATGILGRFFLPRAGKVTTIEVQPSVSASGASGGVEASVNTTAAFTDARVYEQTQFPLTFAMDQQGALLASHFTGVPDRLRIFGLDELLNAPVTNPVRETIDYPQFDATSVSRDYDFGLGVVRRLAFGPQLTVLAPGPGSITRGVVTVVLAVRDPEITRVTCELSDATTGGPTSQPPQDQPVGADQQRYGVAFVDAGAIFPACRYVGLAAGAYVLNVRADAAGPFPIYARVPFVHDASPPPAPPAPSGGN